MNRTALLKLFFLLLLGCCACQNATKNSTFAPLPLDSVAAMVADCYFLESEIYVKQWQFDVNDHAFAKYDSLLDEHGITKEIFVENVKYYITNKKYANKFMDIVDTIVERRVVALRKSFDLEQ